MPFSSAKPSAIRHLKATADALIANALHAAIYTAVLYPLIPWIATTLAPPDATVLVSFDWMGPFTGWADLWMWLTILTFVISLPKTLITVHRRRGRPLPGGAMRSWSHAGDRKLLRRTRDWIDQSVHAGQALLQELESDTVAAERAATPSPYPPCPRCGDPVKDYTFNETGRVLMQFKPCRSRIVLTDRRPRRSAAQP